MEEHEIVNISVIWRGNRFNVEMNSDASLKEFGHKLQHLTNVKPDTLRLLLPKSSDNSSQLLTPFSDAHSTLSLKESSILASGGKSLRMMGVFEDEIKVVSQNGTKEDLRIAGFDEDEKRHRQRMSSRPNYSLKLPQGAYIFCDFRTLHLPGIELNPPASEALKRMHMLAADPGIVAIMNKHRWRVGVMTEMAPVGYVGISPKCLLGFNKNHGEEISLRLRTDDMNGFRKYESIKKTLLHELAHMVYSEHDAQFYALDSQLNQEAASLDWTRSKGHTLSGLRRSDHYEEEFFEETGSRSQKLGGKTTDEMATARATSVAAAHHRIVSSFNNGVKGHNVKVEPDPDDIDSEMHVEPDPDDSTMKVERRQEEVKNPHCEPDHDDAFVLDDSTEGKTISNNRLAEPDPGDSLKNENSNDGNQLSVASQELYTNDAEMKGSMSEIWKFGELDPDVLNDKCGELDPIKIQGKPYYDESNLEKATWECGSEPDPDDSLIYMQHEDSRLIETGEDVPHINKMQKEPQLDDSSIEQAAWRCGSNVGQVPHAFTGNNVLDDEPDPDARIEDKMDTSNSPYDVTNLNDQELQRIQDPVSIICSRLQKTIEMLKSEVNPAESALVLQTLFKIIRNVIEHPEEIKFRRLRKANPQFQRNVAKYKAAMEVLFLVGFNEDTIMDEIGRSETYIVLKRDDPGLLWLAKSSLEVVNMTGVQRFWFVSTASPLPFENDATQPADGQDKMNEDINDTAVDVNSGLSIDELVKLASEKEELLKEGQRKLEKMQDEVSCNHAEIEKMENALVIAKQEVANNAKIEKQKFAKEVLDVVDNLIRASSFVEDSISNIDQSKDTAGVVPLLELLLERLVMTLNQFVEVLPSSTYADTLCQSSVAVKSPKRVEKYNPRKVEKCYPNRPPAGTRAAK